MFILFNCLEILQIQDFEQKVLGIQGFHVIILFPLRRIRFIYILNLYIILFKFVLRVLLQRFVCFLLIYVVITFKLSPHEVCLHFVLYINDGPPPALFEVFLNHCSVIAPPYIYFIIIGCLILNKKTAPVIHFEIKITVEIHFFQKNFFFGLFWGPQFEVGINLFVDGTFFFNIFYFGKFRIVKLILGHW